MLSTAPTTYEASLKAGYRAAHKRLNAGRVPIPIPENPAPSDVINSKSQGFADVSGTDRGGATNTLKAALKALLTHSETSGLPITFAMVELVLRGFQPDEPRRLRIDEIQRLVCHQYNISLTEMCSARRTAQVVRPRMVAMYLAKLLTLCSYPAIGRKFGGRDHTTCLNAFNRIEALIQSDEQLATEVAAVKTVADKANPGVAA